ncbi:hypothetical protein MYCTH_2295168 [Thermothelomyces thermophilus ATCC 42464]|uniref:Uncharacterized protein n=1 Tax=Thermothelomyces thermophilus (strain ATCC 42464 / BCRC 31852 / DSM 1799) TaxID=573729 RepID=G2Q409_THET4|nr:uncharacterized protein MYCTH_2295168 [Thermothelomyces thermophilus ATCC 42464]AEO53608.1 hypothetical protein MYCTH_2295168 [Thermothelomyces thermophilus ATCC 42464]
MNSDDLMSDPAHPANHSSDSKGGVWNTKKFRDEYEMYKNRLQDQRFSVAEYPDPLSPRPPHPKQYPSGTSPELERKLQELIAQVKAGRGVSGSSAA